jgi:phosphomannomutase/phosphoglucomutase
MELKFSTTGIRGISNKTMTAELALKLGKTLGTFLNGKGRILIARDTRTSSEMLRSALVSGLLSTGVNVVDAGVSPVPALSHCVMADFDAGVMITSSHNPPEYNGMKFITGDGVEFSTGEEQKFLELFKSEPISANWDTVGKLAEKNILETYEKKLFELADTDLIKTKNYKVVVDTTNGAQGVLMPDLLKKLGCEVVGLFIEPKGIFERTPEPRPETLDVLKEKVVSEQADFGVAFDVDGDRCIFVNEKGEVIMGDVTGTLLARELIREKPGARIVTPISTSKVMDDVAEKEGGKMLKTMVGAKYIGETLKKEGADYGFEETGGSFFPEISFTRDGSAATVKVLETLAKSGKKLSELVDELPKYYQIKLKVPCEEEKKQDTSKLKDKIDRENKEIITMDGIKVVFEDGSVLMRASGTEPLIRIFVEATSLEKAEEYAGWGEGLVKSL